MRYPRLCPLLLLLGIPLAAETTVTLDNAYATGHVDRGLLLTHAAWQPALTVDSGAWSYSLWSNVPLRSGQTTEIDPAVIYSPPIGPVSGHFGLQGYTYPTATGTDTRYSDEVLAGMDSALPLTPTFAVQLSTTAYYDLRLQTVYLEANLAHTIPLGLIGIPLDLTCNIVGGYSDGRNLAPDAPGPRQRDAYRYVGAGVEADYKLNGQLTLKVGITATTTWNVDPGQATPARTGATVTLSRIW